MSDRLLALYYDKIVQCSEQIKTIEFDMAVVKECYEQGLLKSKRMLNYYLNQGENKKREIEKLQDEYFQKMDFIKNGYSIIF